jgi:hypothetical protein
MRYRIVKTYSGQYQAQFARRCCFGLWTEWDTVHIVHSTPESTERAILEEIAKIKQIGTIVKEGEA